jgi:hypothetical protein
VELQQVPVVECERALVTARPELPFFGRGHAGMHHLPQLPILAILEQEHALEQVRVGLPELPVFESAHARVTAWLS